MTIRVVSSIRGGKGGFGTLLKGQSRQAGAKLTTDFGACRDLQGRRLRHVNDEIKLRKFRDMEERRNAGEKVPENELWQTPSGIYNWHLMTPTWADISNKATYRIKRQFQKLDKEAQKKVALKQEQEAAYHNSMTHYLEQATLAQESIQEGFSDAIQQGLAAAAASQNKRKRPAMTSQPQPNSLCTLTGEIVVMEQPSKTCVVQLLQLQSQSEFGTAVLILEKSAEVMYYEVTLVTGGLAQIGWATLLSDQVPPFAPNNDLGDGVGDDAASFAVDLSRGTKFHAGDEADYATLQWKAGDRLGCLLDTAATATNKKKSDDDNGETITSISFSINGKACGVAFTTSLTSLVPAISCNQGEILELHTQTKDCKYFPKNAVAVGDLVTAVVKEPSGVEEDVKSSKPAPRRKAAPSKVAKVVVVVSEEVTKKDQKPKTKEPIKPKPLDLEAYPSTKELEALGLDRLKSALTALQVKCGGTLTERATRLLSLKGLARKNYPKKVRAKGFVE
jgi:hypothetical protein